MLKLLLYILYIIGFFLILFVTSAIVEFTLQILKGNRIKKNTGKATKKHGKLRRIFYDFPRRFIKDVFEKDFNDFQMYGVHLFCGEQGSGKTISVVEFLHRIKDKYPNCKINTNMGLNFQDNKITDWKQIVERTNGTKGVVEVIDEIQAWFSSNQSKNFPPEMLAEISQQRKQRKMIVGTAQVFSRVSKPIREQVTFVYCPFTIAGCLTVVRRSRPHWFDDEKLKFKKFDKTYFYVHNEKIRNSFDTYERINDYKSQGKKAFKSDIERANNM